MGNEVSILDNLNNENEQDNSGQEEFLNFQTAAQAFAKQNSLAFRSKATALAREIQQLAYKKEKLWQDIYVLKDLKKKKDPRYSEDKIKAIKAEQEQLDEIMYNKDVEANRYQEHAAALDNQVFSMIEGVYNREVEFIKKLKFRFEEDKIIIINKTFPLEPFTTPGIRYSNDQEKLWSYDPYKINDQIGIETRPIAKEYEITVDQDFDKEMLGIARGMNLMMPELLAQQTQYYAVKKMTQQYLQKFLKR